MRGTSFIFIVICLIILNSCFKEELPQPSNDNTTSLEPGVVEGVNWVLADARVYVLNLQKNSHNVYDYFDASIQTANTHITGGTINLIDSIRQNYTSWKFQNNIFTLNNSTSYAYEYSFGFYKVYGLEDGSARPIEVKTVTKDLLVVNFHNAYGSINGENYNYYTELTFIPQGSSCSNCKLSVPYGWVYSGVWNANNSNPTTLEGTRWIVKRYNNGLSGNVYPNDTLDFISQNQYTINSGTSRNYSLSNVVGNNMKSLSLYSFTTLGGDYGGQVQATFIDDWAINNSKFQDLFNVNNTVTLWMIRVD